MENENEFFQRYYDLVASLFGVMGFIFLYDSMKIHLPYPVSINAMYRNVRDVTNKELWDIYLEQGSVWTVAEVTGFVGQTIHRRLKKAGYDLNNSTWSKEEIAKLKKYYQQTDSLDFNINILSSLLKRPYYGIAMKAARLGLTNISREKSSASRIKSSFSAKQWHKGNPHPKGYLGRKHSASTRKILSEKSLAGHKNRSEEKEAERVMKILKTRHDNGTLIPPRPKASWKQAWHVIGGKRYYFRSSWEVNYAHYLQWLKEKDKIIEWQYETKTFWFDKIKRGVRSYTPDFEITELNGDIIFHEIKGWMDDRSKTKIKRMAKYHPDIKLIVIDSKSYKKLSKQLSGLVPGWS